MLLTLLLTAAVIALSAGAALVLSRAVHGRRHHG